jgi:hypothetical protein
MVKTPDDCILFNKFLFPSQTHINYFIIKV